MEFKFKKQKNKEDIINNEQKTQTTDVVKSFIDKVQDVQEIAHYDAKLPEFDILQNKTLGQISTILDSVIPTEKTSANQKVIGETNDKSRTFRWRKTEEKVGKEAVSGISQAQKEDIFKAFLEKHGFNESEIKVDYPKLIETANSSHPTAVGGVYPLHVLYSSLLKEKILNYDRLFKYLKFRQQMIKVVDNYSSFFELFRYKNLIDEKKQSIEKLQKLQVTKVDNEIKHAVSTHNSHMIEIHTSVENVGNKAIKTEKLLKNQIAMLELFIRNGGIFTGEFERTSIATKEFLNEFLVLYKERVEIIYDYQKAKDNYLEVEKKLYKIFNDTDAETDVIIKNLEKEANTHKRNGDEKISVINESLKDIKNMIDISLKAKKTKAKKIKPIKEKIEKKKVKKEKPKKTEKVFRIKKEDKKAISKQDKQAKKQAKKLAKKQEKTSKKTAEKK